MTATFQQLSWLTKEDIILPAFPILQKFIIEEYGGSQVYTVQISCEKQGVDASTTNESRS